MSAGHLLDDQALVETLQQSKTMSQEIHNRVAESEQMEMSISLARQRYLPVIFLVFIEMPVCFVVV